ncbi:hypothetical protein ABBQ32_006193 [Trebouxia sp. C0010 RCD-2024]
MLAAQHMPPGPALPHNQGMASALPPGSNVWSKAKGPAATSCPPGLRAASSSAEPGGN